MSNKPKFDVHCPKCDITWEVEKEFLHPLYCKCGALTKTLLTGFKYQRVKDPFDLVNKSMSLPSSKKVVSYGNDKRKGGKDIS